MTLSLEPQITPITQIVSAGRHADFAVSKGLRDSRIRGFPINGTATDRRRSRREPGEQLEHESAENGFARSRARAVLSVAAGRMAAGVGRLQRDLEKSVRICGICGFTCSGDARL